MTDVCNVLWPNVNQPLQLHAAQLRPWSKARWRDVSMVDTKFESVDTKEDLARFLLHLLAHRKESRL